MLPAVLSRASETVRWRQLGGATEPLVGGGIDGGGSLVVGASVPLGSMQGQTHVLGVCKEDMGTRGLGSEGTLIKRLGNKAAYRGGLTRWRLTADCSSRRLVGQKAALYEERIACSTPNRDASGKWLVEPNKRYPRM